MRVVYVGTEECEWVGDGFREGERMYIKVKHDRFVFFSWWGEKSRERTRVCSDASKCFQLSIKM